MGKLTDVEVACRVAEGIFGLTDGTSVVGENGAGQGEAAAALVDLLQGGGPLGIGVGGDGQDGAEDLLVEETVIRRVGHVDSGVDVVSVGAVVGATDHQLKRRVLVALVDDVLDLVEGALVDDGTHEGIQLAVGASDGDLLDLGLQAGDELLGLGLGEVDAGGGRALLALVLESAADGVVDGVLDVGGRVDEVEVLSAGLADDTGELAVSLFANALADSGVQRAEDVGRPDKVEAGEFAVVKDNVGHFLGVTRDELNDVGGQTSLQEDVVEDLAGVDVAGRRLPDDNVAHQRGAGDKVTANGSEVEGGDGIDEALQRTPFQSTKCFRQHQVH